jgi:hypothetical protein
MASGGAATYLGLRSPAMSLTTNLTYAICPVEDCTIAFEAERDGDYLCPTCRMEMITTCPSCGAGISEEEQVACSRCDKDLKQ